MKLEQWRDVLEALRRSGVSRTLRRCVERWLLGEGGSGGADLAAIALQAEGAFLHERLSDGEMLPALLAMGLAEDVLAAREGRAGAAAVWQPSFDMIGRRLAARVALAMPAAEARLRKLEGWEDQVVGPIRARAGGWLELARACAWTGLGRSPGLFVFEHSRKGVAADVCVLVQRGVAGCDGLRLEVQASRCLLPARLSASSEQAVRRGIVLGLLAFEAQRLEPVELPRRRRRWEELLGPAEPREARAGQETEQERARLGQRSALLRELEAAGTRVEVVLGLGGVEAIDGDSIAAAVAAATSAAMDDRPGRPLRWDTALTGGLDSRGRLLPVLGLSPKTHACLQSRLVALVGPEPNGPALRELELGLTGLAPLRIRTAADLLGALEQAALPPAAARPVSSTRTRLKLAAAMVLGLGSSMLLLGVGGRSVRPRAPVAERSTGFVTWPSVEWGARISPDRKSVLFLSDRDGPTGIWLGQVGGEDFRRWSPPGEGEVSSAAWSPDGREIACMLQDGARVSLEIRPAAGGPPRQKVALDLAAPKLVRWFAGGIYLDAGDNSLRRLDPASARLETVFEDARLKATFGFDVSADELRIVVSASDGSQRDLWLARLDGGAAEPWTRDADEEVFPRWVGPEGRGVVYTSEISGIRNLWWLSSEDASKEQLTRGVSEDFVEDAAGDGSFLILKRIESRANLRSFDLRTRQQIQLTGDRLQDIWPSLAGDGKTLAFQRKKATSFEGTPFDGKLLVAGWDGSKLHEARVAVQDGYAPRLSPDGRWLAYLKTPARAKTEPRLVMQPEIWIQDLKSGQPAEAGDRFLNSGLSAPPIEWVAQNMAWSPDSSALYFVRRTEAKEPEIRRFRPGASAHAGERIAGLGEPGEEYRDLTVSGDGRWLGYVRAAGLNRGLWQARVRDLLSGEDRVIHEEAAAERGTELATKGWLDAETLLLLRSTWKGLSWSVEILSAGLDGKSSRRGTAAEAEPVTAVFDPASRMLYLTCLEGAVQDLCGFSMEDGTWTRWTDNRFPGFAFSRPEIAAAGKLLYSGQEQSVDLGLLQFQR